MNELSQNRPRRRVQRFILIALAALVTLVAMFYLEEDWRGKHAWESCKRELEAKGVVLDWSKYIPTPVPDDQNFFTASTNILVRFRKAQGDAEVKMAEKNHWLRIENSSNSFPIFDTTKSSPLVVAEIHISPTAAAAVGAGTPDLVAKFNDPTTAGRVEELIRKNVGRSARGSAGFEFSELSFSKVTPARILLEAETAPPMVAIGTLIPQDLDTNFGRLRVETTGNDTFQVLLSGVKATSSSDYLKWSDQFDPAFDEVREALKRPYALLPGDYSDPVSIPIPNFVAMRSVCQTLSQRAQCELLLDRPDRALRELTLEHDLCRILGRPPAGRPITLVESMINVAIAGLYANTVGDGLRMHAWPEPQLVALEQQLKDDDLLTWLVASLHGEQVFSSEGMLKLPAPKIQRPLWGNNWKTLWQKLSDPIYCYVNYGPRGWLYQNAAGHVARMEGAIQCFNTADQLIAPKGFDAWAKQTGSQKFRTPYSFLDAYFLPNMSKAAQTAAYNQTQVNEALLACALERYRLDRGEYPDALDTLAPKFIAELPHDIIGGQPLHYRRLNSGNFLLYSVGWNETDDGGKDLLARDGSGDRTKGDWVWRN